jgi:hypothetical protein
MKAKSTDFRQILEHLSRRHDTRHVFDAFTRLAACALSAETREVEYLEEAKRWEKADLDLFAKALGALQPMNALIVSVGRFPLGQLVVTPNAPFSLTEDDILSGMLRHQAGNWGDLDENDRKEND